MNLDLIGNWHLLRAAMIAFVILAFVVFALLFRLVNSRIQRRRKALEAARKGSTAPDRTGVGATTQTPQSWQTRAVDPRLDRRVA